MKTLLTIFLLLTFTSCGTITKKDEFFQIDSSPRGLKVLDEDGTSLGVTPFVSLSKQKSSSKYFIEGDKKSYRQSCSLDWQHSMIPSLLIMPIAIPVTPIISTLFIGTDYLTDNLFSCSDLLYISTKVELGSQNKEIKTIVLPVFEGQNYNIQKLIDKASDELDENYNIIPYSDSLKLFSKYGVTEERFWSLSNIKKQSLLKVIKDSNATNIIIMKINRNKDFEAQVIDLFTNKPTSKSITIESEKSHQSKSFTHLAQEYIYFIPNSITLGGLKTYAYFENESQASFSTSKKNPNNLHWLMSMWAFSSISSPYLFDTWDYDFRLSPQVSLPSFRAEFPDGYSVDVNTYNASYDLSLTGHTPLGSLSMSLGMGMGYFEGEDSLGRSIDDTTPLFHFNLSYVAFYNERVFFKFSLDQNHYLGDSEKINTYALDKSSTISYNIGYYFPELQNIFR